MKIDIHNHILPKEWPDLKQVGCIRCWNYLGSSWVNQDYVAYNIFVIFFQLFNLPCFR